MSYISERDNNILYSMQELVKDKGNYLQEYYYSLSDKSALTVRSYITTVNDFLYWVRKGVDELSLDDVYQYLNFITEGREVSASKRDLVWYSLKNYIGYLSQTRKIDYNFFLGVRKPQYRQTNETKKDILTIEQTREIIERLTQGAKRSIYKLSDLVIFTIFVETGIRVSALINLNIEDVDFEKGTITVREKENKTREMLVSDQLLNIIIDWVERRDLYISAKQKALVVNLETGRRYSATGIYDIIKRLTRNYDVNISPHRLRASCAMNLYRKTGDIELVRDHLGHADIRTTTIYINNTEENLKKAHKIIINDIYSE